MVDLSIGYGGYGKFLYLRYRGMVNGYPVTGEFYIVILCDTSYPL